jgi:phage shock protein C
MYCTQCGIQIDNQARYCHACGTATLNAPHGGRRELRRPAVGGKIAGVCAGVADHFGLDASLVRILWIVLTIWPLGLGLLAYIVCWIVMPKEQPGLPDRVAVNSPRPA